MSDNVVMAYFISVVVALISAMFGVSIYQTNVRQECVLANSARTAAEVFVVCGKP